MIPYSPQNNLFTMTAPPIIAPTVTAKPTSNPSLKPTPRPTTNSPTTAIPTAVPTAIPLTAQPTVTPSTNYPTFQPTVVIESQSKNSVSASSTSNSSTIVGVSVGCVILVLILLTACYLFHKTKKSTAFDKWRNHYDARQSAQGIILNDAANNYDISKFYRKPDTPRPQSHHRNPSFYV